MLCLCAVTIKTPTKVWCSVLEDATLSTFAEEIPTTFVSSRPVARSVKRESRRCTAPSIRGLFVLRSICVYLSRAVGV